MFWGVALHRPSNQPIFTSIFDKTYLNQYVEEISGAICGITLWVRVQIGVIDWRGDCHIVSETDAID